MMISTEKKVIMFFVPRTGTNTLKTMFESTGANFSHLSNAHFGYKNLVEILSIEPGKYGIQDLSEYKIFSFYREPFDRCISIMNYMRRGRLSVRFFHAFYHDEVPLSCASRKTYDQWGSDEMRDMCNSVPMIEVFRKFKWFMERGVFGKTQKRWLDGPVEPLDFRNYDQEVAKVLNALDIDPTGITIPHINPSLTLPEYDHLEPEHEAEIREFLKEDYEFLRSRGITFD